ncbi:MAG: chitobiase/beta-hexosaminidase C-terminal domain-containing protein [Candidatus Cloacimonetes bacterium]|jgi:hypothetical protein|nr:chitobiase/beta-hexosaminidase C-terminal domain-containing protein [Candidatus Cloacimonadota bacterium]MDD2505869.1 chitobiase/beta-hexosaminidase C-terminal domain-containing protein [Candidatus Cloacimonadota bacterium]MDD4147826.1 chitobiase/beta-hexosaminidase C-terminal domain-containing protein [Candidatus Cloacimonadota bacterium]MDD4559280.1 chitobiase/beta-hexosaminidase C-terminal domain-containing protein [Candidatus Cloacimonadota bacterium]
MKRIVCILTALLTLSLLAAAPVVSNVVAAQSGDVILISYRLSHPDNLPCEIQLLVSNDGGASYAIIPESLSGDFGTVAATSDGAQYRILWNYVQDEMIDGDSYRVKVIANDEAGEVAEPVFVPAGGTYDDEVSVTIVCTTDDATIYYTIDAR